MRAYRHREYLRHVAEETPRAPSPWETQQLLIELEQIAPVRVAVEIGVFEGDSLGYWRRFLNPSLLLAIEPDTSHLPPGLIDSLGVTLLTGESQDEAVRRSVEATLSGRPIDFLYIDGDHTLDAIRADWQNYSPLVRPGGIAVLHDATLTRDPTVETYRFWPDVVAGHRTKLIWDGSDRATGLGIVYL